jgi:hypothetical protein
MRTIVIGLVAFLTLFDLFATQAILPLLRQAYGVTPAAMGLAVSTSTIGMAVASLAVAFVGGAALSSASPCSRFRLCVWPLPPIWRFSPPCAFGFHPHPRLSRRAVQCARFGWGLRRLYHRKCRVKPVRQADVGGGCGPFWFGEQLFCLCGSQSCRGDSCLSDHRPCAANGGHGRAKATCVACACDASRQQPPAPRLRDRLLHSLRLTDIDNGYALTLNLAIFVGLEMQKFMKGAGWDIVPYQGNDAWILPIPATFVVGRDSIIRARFVDPDYRKRMAIEVIVDALRAC